MLAVGRTTIYELISTGQLTPIHIGRSVRFPVRQLEDFVDAQLVVTNRRSVDRPEICRSGGSP